MGCGGTRYVGTGVQSHGERMDQECVRGSYRGEIFLGRLGGIEHGVGRPPKLAHYNGRQAAGLARRFVWAAGSVVLVRVRGG